MFAKLPLSPSRASTAIFIAILVYIFEMCIRDRYWPSKDISLNWKEDYHNAIEYHLQKGDYDAATEMLCKDIEDISVYITD